MSGLPVPCPTCDGAAVFGYPGITFPGRECPVCKGAGVVVWIERKVGRALSVDIESLTDYITTPLDLVRQVRARLVHEVEGHVRRLGGNPDHAKRRRFRSARQGAIDWRDERGDAQGTPALAMYTYQVRVPIPEPYTGVVLREE